MAAALIVIEIAAPKVSDGALAVLVSACSRAARDAECVLARNASEVQPAAVAIVTVQSEDKMRVEVGVRQGDHDSWRTKDFAFLATDEKMDRWRAVGFAIGTLAESNPNPEQETSERVASPSSAPRSSPTAPPSSSPPSPSSATAPSGTAPSATAPSGTAPSGTAPSGTAPSATSSASEASSQATDDPPDERERPIRARPRGTGISIGAAAIFGPGLDTSWRLGSALYLDLAPPQMPLFFTVGGSAAAGLGGSSNLTTRWFDVSLGAGMPLLGRLEASGLEFRAQVLAEYFDAHASLGNRSQTKSRWTLGLQGAFGGRIQIMPDLALAAEVQAAGLTGETEVTVGGELVGSSTSFRYLGSVGLRVRLR